MRCKSLLLVIGLVAGSAAQAQVNTGSADLTQLVAIGDSLVAGEVNSSLNEIYQDTSFPLLLYRQVNGTTAGFEQPLIADPGNNPRLTLSPQFTPVPIAPQPGPALNETLGRSFDNLGMVGGARIADLLSTPFLFPPISGEASCELHPLAVLKSCSRFNLTLRDMGTIQDQALGLQPTFVLLWVGGNDALQAASIGTFDPLSALPTAPSLFEADYRQLVAAIRGAGADMAVATVPNVNVVPLLNTIPLDIDNPLAPGTLLRLHGEDRGGPLEDGDRITLFGQCYIEAGCGLGVPPGSLGLDNIISGCSFPVPAYDCSSGQLPDQVVLNSTEGAQIEGTVAQYNQTIRTIAMEQGLAVFDSEALLNEISANGFNVGGVEYTVDLVTGGIFSYDGFHPAPFTYAVIANGFIEAINATFGAEIPLVDLYPFMFEEASGGLNPLPQGLGRLPGPAALRQVREALGLPSGETLQSLAPVDVFPRRVPGREPRPREDRGRRTGQRPGH